MRFLVIEIKKYLADPKKILSCTVCMLLIGASVFGVAQEMEKRGSLFEPFTVGVVDHDQSQETQMLIRFLNSMEDFNKTTRLLAVEEGRAAAMLADGSIPAYFVIPAHFTDDIKTGKNSAFRFYGNKDLPIQAALAKLLAEGGVAFLTSSQAGIYATIDYAYENGLDRETVDGSVVTPINIQFAAKLLGFNQFFTEEVVTLSAGLSAGRYYLFSFAGFLLLLNMVIWIPQLQGGYTGGLMARYRVAGVPALFVHFIRLSGVFTVNLLLCAPLLYLMGWRGLLPALYAATLAMLVADLFPSQQAAAFFLLFFGLANLLVSGGIVPMAYLPAAFHRLQYFTFNYWVVRLGEGYMPMLIVSGTSVLFFTAVWAIGLRKEA